MPFGLWGQILRLSARLLLGVNQEALTPFLPLPQAQPATSNAVVSEAHLLFSSLPAEKGITAALCPDVHPYAILALLVCSFFLTLSLR